MKDCSKCKRADIKCCHTCKKDANKCNVWHHCGSDCPEYEVITNADRIRSMTDEELAELFTKLAWNSEVQTTPLKYLEWLQSEVKGE